MTETGPGSFPRGCCHTSCLGSFPSLFLRKGVGLGDRTPTVRQCVGQAQGD